ncbi:MAG: glycosyltransferase [Acidobacteriota bacterium]
MLYVQYTDPAAYPPLEHSARLLADADCSVRFVGIDLIQGAMSFAPHPRISVALMATRAPGWRQKMQFLHFAWWAMRDARGWHPTWIYASDALSTPAALVVRALTGAQLIYHEHDAPPDAARSIFMRVVRACRRRATGLASVVVVPSPQRARRLDAASANPRVTIARNTPLRSDVRERHTASDDTTQMRALYHGSIVPARLPLSVIDALTELPAGVTLTVAGYDPTGGGHLAALRARAGQCGVAGRVHFVGTVPTRRELLDLTASCDVGLALMPSVTSDANEQTMVGASNKPFDYLACGLALLVADRPEWRDAYVTPGYGRTCVPESASSIASALRWFLAHPAERWRMGEAGRERVLAEWHYEREFAPIARRIVGHEWPVTEPAVVVKAALRA